MYTTTQTGDTTVLDQDFAADIYEQLNQDRFGDMYQDMGLDPASIQTAGLDFSYQIERIPSSVRAAYPTTNANAFNPLDITPMLAGMAPGVIKDRFLELHSQVVVTPDGDGWFFVEAPCFYWDYFAVVVPGGEAMIHFAAEQVFERHFGPNSFHTDLNLVGSDNDIVAASHRLKDTAQKERMARIRTLTRAIQG